MYKRRKNNNELEVTLDSLMDVLTCSVGVMLFVVIFTVIEAKSVVFTTITPLQTTEMPKEKNRVLFICKAGVIKPLNLNLAYEGLKIPELTYTNMTNRIELANKKNIQDDFFQYSYELGEDSTNLASERWPIIHIEEKTKLKGDDKRQLTDNSSLIRQLIKSVDPQKDWIAFAVCDQESIEVFKEARAIANEMGIKNGWDPVKINFPATISLNYSDDNHTTLFLPQ